MPFLSTLLNTMGKIVTYFVDGCVFLVIESTRKAKDASKRPSRYLFYDILRNDISVMTYFCSHFDGLHTFDKR